MRPSRRDVLRSGVVLGAAAAGGPLLFPSRRAGAAAAVRGAGTTLERTVRRATRTANAGGYVLLEHGPGEPHVVRADLVGTARAGRAARRVPLAALVQLTDIHALDAQSPARVEFTDRYDDDPSTPLIFKAAYRPQEPFTTQLADAVIRGARRVGRGPVTGLPLAFAVSTGDNIDNAQFNELRQYIDLLDGSTVGPASGDRQRWEGVHDANPTTYDVHYWHPDGTPDGAVTDVDDIPRRVHGFPMVPGVLDLAQQPFKATGIGMPWYSVFGNHDPLAQGNVAPNAVFNAIAVGGTKVVGAPAGFSQADLRRIAAGDTNAFAAALGGPARPVTADPDRRYVTRAQIIAEHFVTRGTPVGHGFTQASIAENRAYYAFDHGALLRCVVLDTVNPGGLPDGSVDRPQLEWLRQELTANSRAKGGARDRLVAVFSHHGVENLTNPTLAPGETQRRVQGPEVRDLLLEFPNVVLWANGHSHRNQVFLHKAAAGGGFWEVNTAAHIDWPHQSRVIEIVDNRDGTLSVFTTVVDADAPLRRGARLDSPAALASLARELGANDWQEKDEGREGEVEARNAELLVLAPFAIPRGGRRGAEAVAPAPAPAPLPSTGPAPSSDVVAAALAVAAAGLAAAARRERSGDVTDIGA